YAWIVVHLFLRALAGMGWLAESFSIHALTVGAIGGLTIGMMTRTARGHTARPLVADGYELTCFLLVQAAAVVRVFGGMGSADWYLASVQLSGVVWAAAFGLYAVRYWPVLTRPRLDGKPG
ncbi:MAG: NnrS family protein, partial [Betaproteobacteria bacterium]|nr:NnrS family protein [Betaproteobacteria bacterium]